MTEKKIPSPDELQHEFETLLRQRFNGDIQVFAQQLNPKRESKEPPTEDGPMIKESFSFSLRPKDVKAHLDRYVISQDEAKKALSIAVCDHYNHVAMVQEGRAISLDYSKQNVLILGPTGVGKTYLIKKIADLIGVPFVKADATRFSETGYVGANVDDLIRDLVAQANGDIEKAQFGIVYLDEADKLASPNNGGGRDVNGRGVQFGLLKLMEETEVDLNGNHDMQSQLKSFMDYQKKGRVEKQMINTRHILFLVSGAFTGLPELIKKRLKTGDIGFHTTSTAVKDDDAVLLAQAETQDFIQYGFEPEFIGRLPIRVVCHHLDSEHLFQVMKSSEGSLVRQYQAAFYAYGIRAIFEDLALRAIAKAAFKEKTGARALMTVCERTFRGFKFELPSTRIRHFQVTPELIEDPDLALEVLLSRDREAPFGRERDEILAFEVEFSARHGLDLSFDDGAAAAIAGQAAATKQSARALCVNLLRNYEYGLKLIQKNTGQNEFILSREVLEDPDGLLARIIQTSYMSPGSPNSPILKDAHDLQGNSERS